MKEPENSSSTNTDDQRESDFEELLQEDPYYRVLCMIDSATRCRD